MRRPSVPGRSSRAVANDLERALHEPISAPEVDETETQPVEPLARVTQFMPPADESETAPVELEPRGEDAAPGSPAVDSTAVNAETPVTARDVWRATRARRRAQRSEARRFTARIRRKRWIRIGIAGAAVAVIAGVVAIAYSPLFAVRTVAVTGATDELAASISGALQGQLGTPLAAVDLDEVRSTVETFPLVESYQVEARPPHELLVRVVPRTPVGVVRADGGYVLVDAAGVHLATVPEIPAGQPFIDIDPVSAPEAFEAAGTALRALPEAIRPLAVEVQRATGDDTVVSLNSGVNIMWGSGAESALKALVLEQLMAANPQATSFDVSAPEVPVVR